MVINNNDFGEQLLRLINETKLELENKESQKQILEKEIENLVAEKQGYETALRGYQKRAGKPEYTEIDWDNLFKDAETHEGRIVALLNRFGNLKLNQITDYLFPKYIESKSRKNAYMIVSANIGELMRDNIIEKIKKGEYGLKK
jgi:hypothetical protein